MHSGAGGLHDISVQFRIRRHRSAVESQRGIILNTMYVSHKYNARIA